MVGRTKILIIDDDKDFCYVMDRCKKRIPEITEMDFAHDGEEGLSLLREMIREDKPLPDYVFLDINMPLLDGFGFLEEYKRMIDKNGNGLKAVVVAMLTSSDLTPDRERAMGYGVVHEYIRKPSTVDDLMAVLSSHIRKGS